MWNWQLNKPKAGVGFRKCSLFSTRGKMDLKKVNEQGRTKAQHYSTWSMSGSLLRISIFMEVSWFEHNIVAVHRESRHLDSKAFVSQYINEIKTRNMC